MYAVIYALLSRAEQAAPTERFPNPDSVYIDVVDIDTGRAFQATSRSVAAADLQPYVGTREVVVIEAEISPRPRTGGGVSIFFDKMRIMRVAEYEAALAKRNKPAQGA